jgi:hypothetical protein
VFCSLLVVFFVGFKKPLTNNNSTRPPHQVLALQNRAESRKAGLAKTTDAAAALAAALNKHMGECRAQGRFARRAEALANEASVLASDLAELLAKK